MTDSGSASRREPVGDQGRRAGPGPEPGPGPGSGPGPGAGGASRDLARTRFAPSPTGPLHLGHAYAAFVAHDLARDTGGEFLLRIEDIDEGRCRPEWESRIYEDLEWLGVDWTAPVMRQSGTESTAAATAALERLEGLGLAYPCRCRRADVERAAEAPQEGAVGPRFGPDGRVYPGTCRGRPMSGREADDVVRLDMAKAAALARRLRFAETGPARSGEHCVEASDLVASAGDIALVRRNSGRSYHLSVVVDDALQGVTHVTRGEDLFDATALHVLLQSLLGLPTPIYHHHRLIRDETGKRLAKRDAARELRRYRDDGLRPEDLRKMLDLPARRHRSARSARPA